MFTSDAYINPAETGFYYSNSRYYDPKIGRFINADATDVLTKDKTSITHKNLYAYANNNPVNWQDDSGRFPVVAVNIALNVGVNLVSTWAEAKINGEKMSGSDAVKATFMGVADALVLKNPLVSACVAAGIELGYSYVVKKEELEKIGYDTLETFVSSLISMTNVIDLGLPKVKRPDNINTIYNTIARIPFKVGSDIIFSQLDSTKDEVLHKNLV